MIQKTEVRPIAYNYDFKEAVKWYNSTGLQSRNMNFFARWVYNVYKIASLPGTDSSCIERLAVDKTKLSIFAILVDDLADNVELRNKELLEKAIRIPFNGSKIFKNKYLEVTRELWNDIIGSVSSYPRYRDFKEIFFFDLDQFFNSIKYAYLVNSSDFYNIQEGMIYSPNNMMIIIYLDMDLMCSPCFDKSELKKVRPIFHYIQDIMHVGNILNTFPREIEELDFSSPIITLGLSEDVIKKEDVANNPEQVLRDLNYFIPYYKQRVEEDFEKIIDQSYNVVSIDFNEFYPRLRKIWDSFLHRPHYWKKEEARQMATQNLMIGKDKNRIKWVRI